MCDPWIEGKAFHDGWSLLAKTVFQPADFQNVTHIWFSHEHPDHFSPPTLAKIDPKIRSRITVLFQSTADKKLRDFCRKLNFGEFIEMKESEWYRLNRETELLCGSFGGGDSWLYTKSKGFSILNTNDCVINQRAAAQSIKDRVGAVDVLLAQFSYAQWEGNRRDREARRAAAQRKLEQLDVQIDIFKPRYIIPFASFIWFSHVENYYLNDEINRIGDVYNYLLQRSDGVIPIVLYPGESWEIGQHHQSSESVGKYAEDYCNVHNSPDLGTSDKVPLAQLAKASRNFTKMILDQLGRKALLYLLFLRPLKIYLCDYKESFAFSFIRGFRRVRIQLSDTDISMSSDALLYCFQFFWGFNSLHVNGRFEIPKRGDIDTFLLYERLATMINRGLTFREIVTRELKDRARGIVTFFRRLRSRCGYNFQGVPATSIVKQDRR